MDTHPIEVKVFTRHGCVQCTATLRALEKVGVTPVLVDVDADPAAAGEAHALGALSLPVVVVGTTWWAGYRPDKIAALVRGGEPR